MLRAATARRALLGTAAMLLGLFGLQPAAEADGGGVLIVITGIHVGNPVMGTQDACNGWVEHGEPVVPVTINAAFFGNEDPVGPYATATWSGGTGSWDDHFGSSVAQDRFQHFHILVHAKNLGGWHGPGEYTVQAWVQDVGLQGGIAVRAKDVYLPAPSPTVAKVKCTITPPLGAKYVVDQVADAALDKLEELACPVCSTVKGVYDTAKGYSDALDGLLNDSMVNDPPDANYQSLAAPVPAPVLPPPAGLTTAQESAYTQLVTQLAGDVGIARAMYATVNRVWGADNDARTFWHRRQLTHLATLADQLATGLDALPPLWTALTDSFAAIPSFTVGPSDVGRSMSELEQGLSPERQAVLTQLGVSAADQRAIADLFATYVEPLDVSPVSGTDALSGSNAPDLAAAMRTWGQWARSAVEDEPPVVTSVSPSSLPSSGGSLVTISGSHLRNVTGVSFGRALPGHGQGELLGCFATECTVYAPPGRGTVDVVAVGPGGTSQPSPDTRVTYGASDVPHVSSVYPAQGPMGGNNEVTVFGSGLDGGRVDFGTLPAESWRCQPTRCTATAPASGLAGPVDVTVLNDTQRSETTPGDVYHYLTSAPPPPDAPTITGMVPASGTHLGGQEVTITGSNLTGASSVVFGDGSYVDDFAVTDDGHLTLTTPQMDPGTNEVVVHGPGGASAATPADVFTATDDPPTITSISPASGPDLGGTRVTLTGTNLTDGFVDVGDSSSGADSVCTATQCTFTTTPLDEDAPLGPVHVEVWTEDGQSAHTPADLFTFTAGPAPEVSGLDPDTGSTAGGGVVVVSGDHLNGGSVTIGGVAAHAADPTGFSPYCSAHACVVEVPPHAAGDAPVVVTTHAGTSAPADDATYSYVRPPRPVVSAVSPNQAWTRTFKPLTISGHNLEGGTVFLGDVEAQGAECSSSQCSMLYPPWPDGPGTVDVTVRTAGGTSAVGPQTKLTWIAPTITSVTPSSGWTDGGDTVTVTGTHLDGATIRIDGRDTQDVDETCSAATTCVVTAPEGDAPGQVDVVATAPDEITSSAVTAASHYTYTARPPPTVTSLTPDHGNVHGHETVTVTGTALQGASTSIKVGGLAATGEDCQPTSCTFLTPAHAAGSAQVVVTTSAGDSATGPGSQFTYEAPTVPTITSVSPSHGSTAGGTSVTVTGTDLAGTTIRFGTQAQTATCDRTTCTVTTSAHAAGTLDVTAQSDAGTSAVTADSHFTYEVPPTPVITGLSPDTGPASGGVVVTLTGTDLLGGHVSFDGATLGGTCTAAKCTFTQPPGPVGDVPVTVTTLGGTSAPATFHDDSVTLTEHVIPGVSGAAGGSEIVRGLGGDIWFALPNGDAVARLESDGSIVTYPTPPGSKPLGITPGPDGRMWFTEPGTQHIGAVDGSGTVVDYPVPGAVNDLRFITSGPDGRLWFDLTSGAIGAITTTGQVTEYQVPDPTVVPYHLRTGADGRIWFTEWGGRSIGAITTDGVVTEYPLEGTDLLSWDLTTGPDDRLWFTQAVGQAIVAVDTATGEVTSHHLPSEVANPQGMVYGPDGRFWFVSPDVDRVSAWDPDSGDVTYYPIPGGGTRTPKYIAMDGDGTLWVTEVNGSRLLSVTGIDDTAAPEVSSVAPAYAGAGDQVTVTGSTLGAAQSVTVGGASADFDVVDPAHLSVTVPPGSGTVQVEVTTPHGTSPTGPGATFHYGVAPPAPPVVSGIDPPSGPVAGGTTVTVSGSHLSGASLTFGSDAATGVSCSDTACTAVAPPHALGQVHVVATTSAGASAPSDADQFTYLAPAPPAPTVTSISPDTGPADGGTPVTVTGTDLTDAVLWFGTAAAPGSCTATSCTVLSPQGGVGIVHVRASTGGGTSARVAADRFTYTGSGTTASTTALTADPATQTEGHPITLTAHVTPADATGQVTFAADGLTIDTVEVSGGAATATTSSLSVGGHEVTATYSGDDTYAGSEAAPVTVTVTEAPPLTETTTTLEADATSTHEGEPVTLTATVDPDTATGTVTFADEDGWSDEADVFDGVAEVDAYLDAGSHDITATYSGDDLDAPSSSDPVTITVDETLETTTTLTGPATATLHAPVSLNATVSPAAPGQMMFIDETTGLLLGAQPVAGGHATLTTTALGTGRHELSATFLSDDPGYLSSGSDPLVVTITAPSPPPPPPDATVPGAPGHVTAKAAKHGKAKVRWAAPADAGSAPITGYVVVVYKGRHIVDRLDAHRLKLTVKHLKPHKKYRFAVYAVNAVGNGSLSELTKAVRARK